MKKNQKDKIVVVETIGDIVPRVMKNLGIRKSTAGRMDELNRRWSEIVGAPLADSSTVVKFQRNVMFVEVSSPAMMQFALAQDLGALAKKFETGENPIYVAEIRLCIR